MTAPGFRATLRDASAFFAEEGVVYDTFRGISDRLASERIDHAAFGEIGLAAHGFRQFTSTVDIVLTDDGFAAVMERLHGSGYTRVSARQFRDDGTGVDVRFVITDLVPSDVVVIGGRPVMRLEKIIELKLASGLAAAPHRFYDLGLVQKVIEHLDLPLDLAEKLDPSVRDTYIQYWHSHLTADGPDRE